MGSRGIDHAAIVRAVGGEAVRLTPTERRLAVVELTRHGLSARQIAERLRTTRRAVERHRARHRQLAAA